MCFSGKEKLHNDAVVEISSNVLYIGASNVQLNLWPELMWDYYEGNLYYHKEKPEEKKHDSRTSEKIGAYHSKINASDLHSNLYAYTWTKQLLAK